MKKTFIFMFLCTMMLCGCDEPQAMEMETFIMEDTYTIGTSAPELIKEGEAFTEETTVEAATTEEIPAETTTETPAQSETAVECERIAGFYVNVDRPYEQWHFYDDGRFHYAGQDLTYTLAEKDFQIHRIISDEREYDVLIGYDKSLTLTGNGEVVELYEEGSEEILAAREKRR
ncbi:MAG: hypothetical protein IJY73_00700, partial [Oscillospiraceae bacterium]|nr:hypothetical protein [Oscillospiraceae bacterium]